MWNIRDNRPICYKVEGNNKLPVYTIASRPYRGSFNSLTGNFALIASAGGSGLIYLRNSKLNIINTFTGHDKETNHVIFSPDGKLLASCSDDCTIKIWNRRHRSLVSTLVGHKDWVNAIAFSPDGKTIVSASSDRTLKLWNIQTGENIRTFRGHEDQVSSVDFHPSGEIIASGSRDGTVRLWNLKGDCLQILSNEHQTNVRTVTFDSQGKTLAIGGENQPIYLYTQDDLIIKTCTFDVATIEGEIFKRKRRDWI